MARKGRSLKQVYEQHNQNEQERRDYVEQLQREEARKEQERTEAATRRVIDEHKERHPSPPRAGVQEHGPIAPDTRLGFLRNNPQAMPLVPLAPPQDLGQHPDATTYRERVNPATGELAPKRRRD